MARKEKELHLQLYPGWSARDNYAVHAKKKKRKKDPMPGEKGTRPDDRFMDNPAFGKYQGREPCMPRHIFVILELEEDYVCNPSLLPPISANLHHVVLFCTKTKTLDRKFSTLRIFSYFGNGFRFRCHEGRRVCAFSTKDDCLLHSLPDLDVSS